jgi:hypothetical protein
MVAQPPWSDFRLLHKLPSYEQAANRKPMTAQGLLGHANGHPFPSAKRTATLSRPVRHLYDTDRVDNIEKT